VPIIKTKTRDHKANGNLLHMNKELSLKRQQPNSYRQDTKCDGCLGQETANRTAATNTAELCNARICAELVCFQPSNLFL
uniref:Uncharacterized protein n=1 Tax=Cyprinus carpio TaxID=7962 RepID=A0A8C1XXT0_CYPCA